MLKSLGLLAIAISIQVAPLHPQRPTQSDRHYSEAWIEQFAAERIVFDSGGDGHGGQKSDDKNPIGQDSSDSYARWGFWSNFALTIITSAIAVTAVFQARAALRQAHHVAISERAWMIAEMGVPNFTPYRDKKMFRIVTQLRNKGKTPAFILESASVAVVLRSNESLPETPPPYPSIARWDDRGVPLAPEGEMGGDIVREFEDAGKLINGQMVLWVYGYVKYNDVFMLDVRETKFCFRWEPAMMNRGGYPYTIDGPKGYNSAT